MSGGKSNSDSSTNTTANTTNNVQSTDGRIVASDAAVAVSGSGTAIRNDTTNFNDSSDHSTYFADSSNHSTNFADSSNHSTNFADSSNHSTYFSDSSVRDAGNTTTTTTNYTSTDFGSVKAALDGMGQMGNKALGISGDAIQGAINSLNATGQNQVAQLSAVLDFAGKQSANALTSANQALGYVKDSVADVKSAYADSKDPDQKVLLAMLAVVGLIGAAFAFKGN